MPRLGPPGSYALSQGLVSIVAVVYGVALSQPLTTPSGVIFNPQRAAYFVPALALFASLLLTSYAFFSVVLVRADLGPYDIQWTRTSSGSRGAIDFAIDLLIAGLYVRLLTAALAISPSTGKLGEPSGNFKPFVVSLIPVFVVGFVVRLLRARDWMALVTLGGLLGSIALAVVAYREPETRRVDLNLVYGLLAGAVIYVVSSHMIAYYEAKCSGLLDPPEGPAMSPPSAGTATGGASAPTS